MADTLTVQPDDDRFDRLRRIDWWDQPRLAAARVLVVGAGALGNELIKNLALLGVGSVVIVDLDRVENSNLARSILFREADIGQPKARTAAIAARAIYPQIKAHAIHGDLLADVGLGVFARADVVLGGLDNREARLAINAACVRLGKPYLDGAIESISGVVRGFRFDRSRESPCYECTLSQRDFDALAARRSCNLLSRGQMLAGHTPTTPTIASIIAGVQIQEVLKILHGRESLDAASFNFVGDTCETFKSEFQRRSPCGAHEWFDQLIELDAKSNSITVGELIRFAHEMLGEHASLEFSREIIERFDCACGKSRPVFKPAAAVRAGQAVCECGRTAEPIRLDQPERFADRTPADLGVPTFDIISARAGERLVGLLLAGDESAALGVCASENISWT